MVLSPPHLTQIFCQHENVKKLSFLCASAVGDWRCPRGEPAGCRKSRSQRRRLSTWHLTAMTSPICRWSAECPNRLAVWCRRRIRHWYMRLHELLVAEGHRVGVTVVKDAVPEWKRQRREVFAPLTYRPGHLARGRSLRGIDVNGKRRKGRSFLMCLIVGPRLLRGFTPPARLRHGSCSCSEVKC
jgi:hypothetical protein